MLRPYFYEVVISYGLSVGLIFAEIILTIGGMLGVESDPETKE